MIRFTTQTKLTDQERLRMVVASWWMICLRFSCLTVEAPRKAGTSRKEVEKYFQYSGFGWCSRWGVLPKLCSYLRAKVYSHKDYNANNKRNQVKMLLSTSWEDWASPGWSSGGIIIIFLAWELSLPRRKPYLLLASTGEGEVSQGGLLTAKLIHHSVGQLIA